MKLLYMYEDGSMETIERPDGMRLPIDEIDAVEDGVLDIIKFHGNTFMYWDCRTEEFKRV